MKKKTHFEWVFSDVECEFSVLFIIQFYSYLQTLESTEHYTRGKQNFLLKFMVPLDGQECRIVSLNKR